MVLLVAECKNHGVVRFGIIYPRSDIFLAVRSVFDHIRRVSGRLGVSHSEFYRGIIAGHSKELREERDQTEA